MHWYYFYATTHKVCSLMTMDEGNSLEMILTYTDKIETCQIMNSLSREMNYTLPANWIFV